MVSDFYKILLLWILFFIVGTSVLNAQATKSGMFKDSIRTAGYLVAFRDTLHREGDTIIVRKEVWIRERNHYSVKIDTIRWGTHDVVGFIHDTVLIQRDTIVIVEDSNLTRNARVLHHVRQFTERKSFWSKMLSFLVVFEDPPKTSSIALKAQELQQTEKRYDPFEGKIIRNINIRTLNVFGYSMSNPDRRPKSMLEKGGNFFHIRTHRWIVRNKLLFSRGDTINSLKISESERLLRDNNFIYDARIFVNDTLNSDSVDVDVIVQDVWSLSAGISGDPSSLNLKLNEVNFLGLGQNVKHALYLNPSVPRGYNYAINYIVNNIYKTYLTGYVYYRFEFGNTSYGGGVNRDFISPAMKWAGGLNLNWYSHLYILSNPRDSVTTIQPKEFRQDDAWLGYGLNISPEHSYYKGSRFIFSGRIVHTYYYKTPVVPDTLPNTFYNSQLYLGSIGVIGRKFFRDKYVFRLGRTEDIPEGYMLALTGGVEHRAAGNRLYTALSGVYSKYHTWGYLHSGVSIGAYYNQGRWEEGVFTSQLLYFTPLMSMSNWKFRKFIGFRFIKGIHPLTGTYLYINQEQGVRGVTSTQLRGTSKLILNYELNVIPPLKLLGFRAALIFFTDLAWIGKEKKLLSYGNFFPGIGAGIRFRNDHLIFSTVQINVGYYPNNSNVNLPDLSFFERSSFYYSYYNFQFNRPGILPY